MILGCRSSGSVREPHINMADLICDRRRAAGLVRSSLEIRSIAAASSPTLSASTEYDRKSSRNFQARSNNLKVTRFFRHARACPGHDVFQHSLRRGCLGPGITKFLRRNYRVHWPHFESSLRTADTIQQVNEQYYNGLRSLRGLRHNSDVSCAANRSRIKPRVEFGEGRAT